MAHGRRGKNLKSCLENKRSLGKHGWLQGGGEIIGTRESFSNKLHLKRSVDLSKVSRISLEVSVESNEKKAAITRLSETRINRWWPMRFYQERLVVHSSTHRIVGKLYYRELSIVSVSIVTVNRFFPTLVEIIAFSLDSINTYRNFSLRFSDLYLYEDSNRYNSKNNGF